MTPASRAAAAEHKCLAIDLGAGSGRVVSGWISNRRWNLKELGRFRTPTRFDQKFGYQCWDLGEVFSQIRWNLECASKTEAFVSIGVDSWGVDYVLLDDQFCQVGVPVSYRDKRTAGVMEHFEERMPRNEIYRRTGIQFLPFNTLYQLAACVEQHPDWISSAQHLLMIPDYMHFRLSGKLSNEYTNASTTQMCTLEGDWDPVLIATLGLNASMLHPPMAAGTFVGDGIGSAVGLKVIAPATHDTASAVAGTPLESANEAYISSGTWSLMGMETRIPVISQNALRLNFTNEGGLERRFRFLKNIMGMWPIQRICEEHNISDVGPLVHGASDIEPWEYIINVNDPEFLDPPSMTQAIQNYCRESGQSIPTAPAQLARCIFDSLALSYRDVKDQLESLTDRTITKIRIVGGGCKNHLLNQLCADACQKQVIAGPIEASALGNLSAQMIALGMIEDLTSARELIRRSFEMHEYQPRTTVPDEVIKRFEDLLASGKGEVTA
jgi:rhamnulokinase